MRLVEHLTGDDDTTKSLKRINLYHTTGLFLLLTGFLFSGGKERDQRHEMF